MTEPMTIYQTENLLSAIREHRNYLANQLEKSEVENNTLLAKVVELEIEVSHLKMEAEEKDKLVDHYRDVLLNVDASLPRGIVGEPQ